MGELSPKELPLLLILMVGLGLLTWGAFYLILHNANKAALAGALALLLFLSFGHFWYAIHGFTLFGIRLDRSRQWLPIFGLILIVGTWLIRRARGDLSGVLRFVTLTLGILIALALFNAGRGLIAGATGLRTPTFDSQQMPEAHPTLGYLPDIYYIILDGYAGEHTLKAFYDFDNSLFLDSLRALGFYIADSSFSNYPYTITSLASSMSMDYLDFIPGQAKSGAKRDAISHRLIWKSKFVRRLKSCGYRYVLLRNGFVTSDRSPLADTKIKCGNYNEMLKVWAHMTMLFVLENKLVLMHWHRESIVSQLKYMKNKMPGLAGPKFVFTHILIPHPPYIFHEDGSPATPSDALLGSNWWLPRSGYIEQLKFLNRELIPVVKGILASSDQPPVIIIQGDHGTAWVVEEDSITADFLLERTNILNGWHLPGGLDSLLYPTITPVNSFRLVLRGVLGMDAPPVEDRVYFSNPHDPYNFRNVTDVVRRRLREVTATDGLTR